jgi:hypothetical protein
MEGGTASLRIWGSVGGVGFFDLLDVLLGVGTGGDMEAELVAAGSYVKVISPSATPLFSASSSCSCDTIPGLPQATIENVITRASRITAALLIYFFIKITS